MSSTTPTAAQTPSNKKLVVPSPKKRRSPLKRPTPEPSPSGKSTNSNAADDWDPKSCCSCDICYCGPNCQCTETLCRCMASDVLNSLKGRERKEQTKIAATNDGSQNNHVWSVTGITCCNVKKIETLFHDNNAANVLVDKDLGSIQAAVVGDKQVERLSDLLKSSLAIEVLNVQQIVDAPTTTTTTTTTTNNNNEQSLFTSSSSSAASTPKTNNVSDRLASAERTKQVKRQSPLKTPKRSTQETLLVGNNIASEKSIVEMAVGGMTCSMCSSTVQKALQDIPAVKSATVSIATMMARIEYVESTECNVDVLKDAIEDVGFTVDDILLPKKAKQPTTTATAKTVEILIDGMTCTMCSNAVQNAISALPNVESVSVSLATNLARINYIESDDTCHPDILKETIEDIGYTVRDVLQDPEQQNCETNHDQNNNDDNNNDSEELDDRLHRLLRQQNEQLAARKRAFLWSLAGTCPILLLTMVIPYILPSSHDFRKLLQRQVTISYINHSFVLEALILWALATPVQFGSGYSFYKSSYYGIMRGMLGMDVLVALGTTASYAYATLSTWTGEEMSYHFFETSAVLICFVLLGKWMNALAVRRTSEALTQLMNLQSKTALKVTIVHDDDDGNDPLKVWDPLYDAYEEETVPIQSVNPGDMVKVLKGASIPADGVVLHGEMSVDESMITGESVPVLKTPGSIVLGGTICTETGNSTSLVSSPVAAAFVQVTGVGSSTALAQILNLVQDAQGRQVPIQNLADSISSVFVPTVVTISVLTYMIWYALCNAAVIPPRWYDGESPATFSLMFGIACLVISCPCALGLATPTAVMVGTGVGAKHGILMKGGETLEMASKVTSVIFDKTGTLTCGKPVITDFERIKPYSFVKASVRSIEDGITNDNDLLWLLGSLERNSEHPLAAAVVTFAENEIQPTILKRKPFGQPSHFQALTGRGAFGIVNGKHVAVGNRAFAKLKDIAIPPQAEECMQRLEQQGKTAILASVNQSVCAVLGIADELKSDAKVAIAHLRNKYNIDVWMVTGDNRQTAQAIANKLDIPVNRVISEALPVAKVEQVRKLQAEGHVVAMIGDGVNDSPALAEANVGMSLGTGAEIAAEASDMVLVRGNVTDVCTALHLSQTIFRRIKLNFLWSLLYNCLSIPLAAGVFFPLVHTRLPPAVAALAMALSSISVVFSSLALRLYRPPKIGNNNNNNDENEPPEQSEEDTSLQHYLLVYFEGIFDRVRSSLFPQQRTTTIIDNDNDLTESLLGGSNNNNDNGNIQDDEMEQGRSND